MATKRRRPTKAEKELQERCESLERRIDGFQALRTEEAKQWKETREKQAALIERLERDLNQEREEHRSLRYSTREEIEKLTRTKQELKSTLDTLRIKHDQLGDAFQAAVKAICN